MQELVQQDRGEARHGPVAGYWRVCGSVGREGAASGAEVGHLVLALGVGLGLGLVFEEHGTEDQGSAGVGGCSSGAVLD